MVSSVDQLNYRLNRMPSYIFIVVVVAVCSLVCLVRYRVHVLNSRGWIFVCIRTVNELLARYRRRIILIEKINFYEFSIHHTPHSKHTHTHYMWRGSISQSHACSRFSLATHKSEQNVLCLCTLQRVCWLRLAAICAAIPSVLSNMLPSITSSAGAHIIPTIEFT